jgi:hypothetical protein
LAPEKNGTSDCKIAKVGSPATAENDIKKAIGKVFDDFCLKANAGSRKLDIHQ